MIEKPKSKVEDIARRRALVRCVIRYLIIVLIGVPMIALLEHNPVSQIGWVVGLFAGTLAVFVMIWIEKPHNEKAVADLMPVGPLVGMIVGFLVMCTLWALGA